MKKQLLTWGILACFMPCPAEAQGIPVYDAAGFTQVVTQLEQMAKDYQKQIAQLEEAVKQTSALTGQRGAGSLLNDDDIRKLRQYLPDNADEYLALGNEGGETSDIYDALVSLYGLDTSETILSEGDNTPMAHAIDRRNQNIMAAMAASKQAYKNAGERLELYGKLLNKLDQSGDLKDSIDLQARIAAENGMVMTELVRLKTIKLQLDTSVAGHGLVSERRAEKAHHYDADAARAAMKQNP